MTLGDHEMKAMCRYCAKAPPASGVPCKKCGGSGFFAVTIPEGDLYTLKCRDCGFENGGRIVNEDLPLRPPDIGCFGCGVGKDRVYYMKVSGNDPS